jgi:fructose-specific phosphotransferase system IIA component
MKLIDVLREECVVAGAQFQDKAEVLRYVAQLAKKSSVLKDVPDESILTGLQERESLSTTGIGNGIAIPHCRLESVTEFVVGIITVPDAVDFKSLDEKKVNLIFFIIGPKAESNRHLKLLSSISQTISIPGVAEELLNANTPEIVHESFLRHTHADIETDRKAPRCLLNIFVQNENVFRDILETIEGMETSSITVVNAEHPTAYLVKMPLFADLWRDKPSEFSKIIVTVISKDLTNEVIRRVESITGNLDKCTDVMVTIQNIFYSAGSL